MRGGPGVIEKTAFLLLFLILLSAGAGAVPTAALSANPSSGTSPLAVDFSGSSCTDNNMESPIVSCTIKVGDGNAAVDLNSLAGPYIYHTRGTYDVNLFALNNAGQSDDTIVQVTVQNQNPTAVLHVSPTSGYHILDVTLSGFCEDLDGNTTLSYCLLDYGDGNWEIIASPYNFSKQHSYYSVATYQAKLTANDDQDVNAQDSEAITVNAPEAPTINNKKPSTDVNIVRPTVSFDINDSGSGVNIGSLALFIDGNSMAGAATKTQFGSNYHVSWAFDYDLANAKRVYVGLRVADNLGNNTGDVNWDFLIDGEAPTIGSITIEDNEDYTNDTTPTITLNSVSGSPSQMALSCEEGNWKAWQSYSSTVSDFDIRSASYGCLGSGGEGAVAIYLILKDAAGNWSSPVSDSTYLDTSSPSKPDDLTASSESDGDIYLDWDSSNDSGGSAGIIYYIYRGTSSGFSLGTEISTTSSTDYTDDEDNLSEGTRYYYKVKAKDRAGNFSGTSNPADALSTMDIDADMDTTEPYLRWELPAVDSTVSGIVQLKVQSYDDESSIRFVKFYVDDVPIDTDNSAVSERYSIDWNSETVVDGTHTLKALAKNRSGDEEYDTTVKTITVTTDNGIVSIGQEGDAEAACNSADEEKAKVDVLFEEMNCFCIGASDEVNDLLEEAEELLQEANELLADGDFAAAEEKAEEAKEKFEELQDMFSIDDYGSAQAYVYNQEQLALFLQGVGLDSGLVAEAEALLGDFSINRSTAFKKVSDQDDTYYKAIIRLVVKNNSGESKTVQLIEVIPKAFAGNADKIAATRDFTVIVADPIIKWSLVLAPGEQKEINYALKENLDRDAVDAIAASEPIESFITPPILLQGSTSVNEANFSAAAVTGGTGFFSLGNAINWIAWVVAAIIVIAVALFAFNYLQGRRGERPFGLAAIGREKGLLERIGSKIPGFGGGEEEGQKPRWGYRG